MSSRRNSPFRKLHGIPDRDLMAGIGHHTLVLRGMSIALTKLIRERRLLLLLHVAEVAAIIWLVMR